MQPKDYTKMTSLQRRNCRNDYVKFQNGLCHFCNHDLNGSPPKEVTDKKINRNLFPQNFFKFPVHLHHDHNTGMTIGAVHNYCNAVLWQYHGE